MYCHGLATGSIAVVDCQTRTCFATYSVVTCSLEEMHRVVCVVCGVVTNVVSDRLATADIQVLSLTIRQDLSCIFCSSGTIGNAL